MPEIPVNSIVGFLGVLLLIFGFFLAIAGSQIIKIVKVSVAPGPRTWGFGIVLLIAGLALIILDVSNFYLISYSATEETIADIPPTLVQVSPTTKEVPSESTTIAISKVGVKGGGLGDSV
jgi:uncharacterized membrane protein